MKTTSMLAALIAAVIVLAGCSATGDYLGPDRGVDVRIDSRWGSSIRGRSTTYKFGTEKPLGTLTITPDGALDMTGPAVEIYALKLFCDTAPNAEGCNGL